MSNKKTQQVSSESVESIEFPHNLSIENWSGDGKLGISFSREAVASLVIECVAANDLETGGILIGSYNEQHDHAYVTEVLGAPVDSKSTPNTFERGVYGLKAILSEKFNATKTYYLGEWHFHPNSTPNPSSVDRKQLEAISKTKSYNCPEPIMVIMAGNRSNFTARIFLFSKSSGHVELTPKE